jgi:chromosome segregation protein
VYLRSIRLRGFKSFPDHVEIRLEPGVAVVVGPNGSGKSNVADGILWASGSLSPTELRAEKPDDVLFAGSGDRPPAKFCEVELNFDNSDGGFSELPYADVAISRRLHRGGEGQYLVNGATVRRIDIVELLADVGLGGGISVIGQGRVEEILASSPELRRDLVEEAAGVGRFKRRRHRAELKLTRVSADVARARDLEEEVRKRLRPLALQATAAERADRLKDEIQALLARIAELELHQLEERLADGEERRTAAAHRRKRAETTLEELLAERGRAEDELADAAGRRETATAALYRLRSAGERLELRRESAESLAEGLRSLLAAPVDEGARARAELEREALAATRAAQQADLDRESLAEQARVAADRLEALERSLAEREGLPPAARALAEAGESLALGLLEVEEGYERAVAAALAGDAAALVAQSPEEALGLVERARNEGLGSLSVVVPSNRLVQSPGQPPVPGAEPLARRVHAKPGGERVAALLADAWLVEPDRLADATHAVAVTKDGRRFEPGRGAAAFVGAAAEAVQLELEARRRSLAAEAKELERRRQAADAAGEEAGRRAAEATAALERAGPGRAAPTNPALAAGVLLAAERLAGTLVASAQAAERLEAPLRARADAGSGRVRDLGEELRTLGAREAEARGAAAEAAQALGAVEVELARVEAEAQEARRRLETAGAEPPPYGSNVDGRGQLTREELEAKVDKLERRRVALGQVNPLAREEYEREKERLTELAEQREDLERSLDELEQLRAELTETVEGRFAETFAAVQENFEEVAQTLFPGGEGRLRLTEPESDEDEAGEPGVEVELRPAGKRITRLSLLSGGEKALGAIAFLFSLFLARPAPFYLLDEVEAALDDRNIARFVELLRRYAGRAQFIVVTHQKATMEAADTLYGVTMGQDGVTQVVSRRVPREEPVAATA